MKINLVEFDLSFLKLSWLWLNDPEIKELTNTPNLTKEAQRKWFDTLKTKSDYLIWGIMAEINPIGVCGLKNITKDDCEYWGYIGEKQYWGKGIGNIIMELLENKAKELGVKSIWLQVVNENERAKNLYLKREYIIENLESKILIMRKSL